MAFSLTATGINGSEVKLEWTDADDVVSVFRTTTDYTGDIANAFAEENLGTALLTESSSLSYTDFTTIPSTTYYYYAFDGTSWDSASISTSAISEFQSNFNPKTLLNTNQADVFVANQNTYGAVTFNLPVATGYLAIVAIKTSAALTDASLESILGASAESYQIIAQDNITAATGYSPKIEGKFHLKYAPVTP